MKTLLFIGWLSAMLYCAWHCAFEATIAINSTMIVTLLIEIYNKLKNGQNALRNVKYLKDYLTERNKTNQEMKERAIKAFIEATDGYFIVGGTDYSKSVIEAFKSKLSE